MKRKAKTLAESAADFVASESPDVKLLLRENQALKAKLLKGQGLEDAIVAAVQAVLEDPAPIPESPEIRSGHGGEETAVLHVSDTQIGKRTSSFDHVVAAARLMDLGRKTVEITTMRRSAAKIESVHVLLGGDMVEHESLFGSQPHHISIPLIDQATNHGPAMIEAMLRLLLEHFAKVHVVGVVGNHGRSGPAKGPQAEVTNWDRVLYRVLKSRMGESERLSWDIPDTWYAVDRIYDWGNLVVHGDQIRGGFAGFPWYGTAKRAWGWIDSIPRAWDYLWFGHFHTYASAVLNYRTFLANGTLESDNTYAQEQLSAAGWPCQRLAFFNARHGLIADHQVFLGDRKPALKRGGRR